MDAISWFWHPMALYVGFLGLSTAVFIGGIVLVFALALRGAAKPSTLPLEPGAAPAPEVWFAASPTLLVPGQLPTAGEHDLPRYTGGMTSR